jgi:hypothetical protein
MLLRHVSFDIYLNIIEEFIMNRDHLSLHAMLQKGMNNDIPETVLEKCPEADRLMIENLLRIAQTELVVLNLAGTTVNVEGHKTIIRCPLTGPSPSVSLSSMRSLQAYSPARVSEVKILLVDGQMNISFDVCDLCTRIGTSEFEIVRITKRHRSF